MLCALLLPLATVAQGLELWYDHPAKSWMNEALPIGNGYMGAMFFGGTNRDRIQISEEGFWEGGPGENAGYNGGNKREGWKHLAEIRSLLANGEKEKAGQLAERYMTGEIRNTPGEPEFGDYGALQPFGTVLVSVENRDSAVTDYRRSLNLEQALGTVSYQQGGTRYRNEFFASYPARLLVFRYSNDAAAGKDYTVAFESPHRDMTVKAEGNNRLKIKGRLIVNRLPFEGEILVKTDGRVKREKDRLLLQGARYAEVYVTVATAYQNVYPAYTGKEYRAINRKAMAVAENGSYDALKTEHGQDFDRLFSRVVLNLGHNDQERLPTDRRQVLYSKGAYDPALEALYFQYGRYLLISSSRPGTMPAHLQGKWNDRMNPPWACDYHMNINLQMIYWPAEVTNLSECHQPLIDYIDKLREPGRVTAREYFNARGWSVHTMNNAYGFTAPGWSFFWGYAPNSAAWLCNHVWEHFSFTQDMDYLKNKAYPILCETAEFWLDYLTKDRDGKLISTPSYSPEHGDITEGATIDQEIAWDLFTNLIEAAGCLGKTNDAFVDSVRTARDNLLPLKIGQYGQLQEWKDDLDDPKDDHRHVSHLYALYPGRQISPLTSPQFANAAKRTLIYRGEGGTGWSLGWKINFWARLLDGNQSYKMLRNILTPSVGDGNRGGSGSYNNLLCAHPPFQIDGNMGAVSGMAELLLQSYTGTLQLLPALPSAWPTGSVTGLKARGNFVVDLNWKNGLLESARITAGQDGPCKLTYKGRTEVRSMKKGETIVFKGAL